MKARALIPVAGLIVLPLAACQGTSATVPSASPSTAVPSITVSPVTPPVHRAPSPAASTTTKPVSHPCTTRYENGMPLPDPKCTPGAVLTTSTADVCSPGWAEKHREYFTKAQREAAFAKYGVITANPAGYGEYDHLIPLELGGSNSTENLWPEPGKIPNAKDAVEDALHEAVCSGHASLVAAQRAIASDWTTAGTKVIEVGSGLKSAPAVTRSSPPPAPVVSHSAAPAGCSPKTSSGNCYRRGEFCPADYHGDSGVAGNGTPITCEQTGVRTWQWE